MEKENNDLINKLKDLPQQPFPELKKKQILSAMKETKPIFFSHIKIVGLSLMTLMIAIILINPIERWNSAQTIVDEHTPKELPTVTSTREDEFIVDWRSDNMDRGQHDFSARLVVTPLQDSDMINRGDVVYFKNPDLSHYKHLTPPENSISRIVGLPGETIKIEKGQVYIDGKKLVSFYANEYHTGIYVENSEVQLEELELAEDEFFVLGDNWWRSIDSKHFGPVHKESIIGKVTGILE